MKEGQHPHCYPGTDVLINKRGCRTHKELKKAERVTTASRLGTLADHPITPEGLRRMHKHLFEQLYDWAGEYRTVTTGRGRLSFCRAEYIEKEVEKRFAAINKEGDLAGLPAASFAERAAEHINELNAIHPFLDGNGRAQRALLVTLGRKAGHVVDLARMDPVAWNKASEAGFYTLDNGPMTKIISGAIVRERDGLRMGGTTSLARAQQEEDPEHPAGSENGEGPKAIKLFVTKFELESALFAGRDKSRSPVVRLLAEGTDSVRFLSHRKTVRGFEPDAWLAGAEALNALLRCFGSAKYRSLHVDPPATADGNPNQFEDLLADAVASTRGRDNSVNAPAATKMMVKPRSLSR